MGYELCDKHAVDPTRRALVYVDMDGTSREYTFADIKSLSNRLGNALRGLGIVRGDRVAILLSQRPETAISHVAAFKIGAISMPLFTQFGPDALEYRLSNSGAKVLITDAENVDKVWAVRDRLPNLQNIIVVPPATTASGIDFYALIQRASDQLEPVMMKSDDPGLIIYTSGTTGQPKGTLHAHRLLEAHRPMIAFTHDGFPQAGDLFWTPGDWAWGGGLLDSLFPSWYAGVPIVAHRFRKFDPEAAFALISTHGVRNSFMPPTALKMMREVQNPLDRWPHRMRSINSGGESLGADMLEWCQSIFGFTVNEFWGQTEANLLTGNSGKLMPVRPGSIGRATPGHIVEVLDPDGNILPPGELGVFAAKGPDPIFFLGYWNNPEATAAKYQGDWMITGDMGTKDSDGYFWFVGRNDDMIKSGADRIGPTEIEECIMRHPSVSLVAVVGSPDRIRGSVIKAFVRPKPGEAHDDALVLSIQEHVKKHLATYQYPREIEFIDEFPMTTTGKIRRLDLRERERIVKQDED
jgi:acetyl-CoA synthetase